MIALHIKNRILLRDTDFDFSMTDSKMVMDSETNPFEDVVANDQGTTSDTARNQFSAAGIIASHALC